MFKIQPQMINPVGQNPDKYTEILKLHRKLKEANIPHDLHKSFDGWQICYPSAKDCKCSVIEHSFSYGNEDNRLEIMGLLTEEEQKHNCVVGWLTAVNVFRRIKKDYKREKTNE